MAGKHSYTITLKNNASEDEAIIYLMGVNKGFLLPTKEGRKRILELLNLPITYSRAFDLFLVPGHINSEEKIHVRNVSKIKLVELKTTKKRLISSPKGFFFGATQNEFDLAERLGEQFSFCFVCLHAETPSYHLLTLKELEKLIKTKRTQFQINL
ncbi:MAG TPA: hypothetical protein VI112_18165 [Bacteroidia bacterium]|jgi:hypothetical protein